MACSQQNASSGFPYANYMTGSRSAEDAIVSDYQLIGTIRSADFGNQLCDFGVPVSSISSNDKCAPFYAFRDGEKDAGNETLAVVGLLEDFDFLSEAGAEKAVRISLESSNVSMLWMKRGDKCFVQAFRVMGSLGKSPKTILIRDALRIEDRCV
jgi:hypothetical protein